MSFALRVGLLLSCSIVSVAGTCYSGSSASTPTILVFGNGINTTRDSAQNSLDYVLLPAVEQALGTTNADLSCLVPWLAYDSCLLDASSQLVCTATAAGQLLDAAIQRGIECVATFWSCFEQSNAAPTWFQNLWSTAIFSATSTFQPDLTTHEAFYSQQLLNGNRIVVVAHSQGNLYVNQAYGEVTGPSGHAGQFHIVAVASPDTYVGGGGQHFTLYGDVITDVAPYAVAPNIRNATVTLSDGSLAASPCLSGDKIGCHLFDTSYMAGDQTKPAIVNAVVGLILAPNWSHFTLSGGPAISQPSAPVYDPTTYELIIFGGSVNGPCCSTLSDVWIVKNADNAGGSPTWQQLHPVGDPNANPMFPQGRTAHSAVYDQANNRMIIFGGGQPNGVAFGVRFNDVWVLQNANGVGTPQWQNITPTSGPMPAVREGQKAAYDPTTNSMIVFGGGNNGIMDVPADVWVLTNANGLGGPSHWIQTQAEGGNAPARRQGHGVGYDPASNRLAVFGGCCYQLPDLWVLMNANNTGGAWQPVSQGTPAPGGRSDFASGYDPTMNRFILTSGLDANRNLTNDLWVLQNANGVGTAAWVNTVPNNHVGSPPATNPQGIYDATENLFFSFTDTNNLWVLSNANSVTPVQ